MAALPRAMSGMSGIDSAGLPDRAKLSLLLLPAEILEVIIALVVLSLQTIPSSKITCSIEEVLEFESQNVMEDFYTVHDCQTYSNNGHRFMPTHRPNPNATPLLLTSRKLYAATKAVINEVKANFVMDLFYHHNHELYITWACIPFKPTKEIEKLTVHLRSCPCLLRMEDDEDHPLKSIKSYRLSAAKSLKAPVFGPVLMLWIWNGNSTTLVCS